MQLWLRENLGKKFTKMTILRPKTPLWAAIRRVCARLKSASMVIARSSRKNRPRLRQLGQMMRLKLRLIRLRRLSRRKNQLARFLSRSLTVPRDPKLLRMIPRPLTSKLTYLKMQLKLKTPLNLKTLLNLKTKLRPKMKPRRRILAKTVPKTHLCLITLAHPAPTWSTTRNPRIWVDQD